MAGGRAIDHAQAARPTLRAPHNAADAAIGEDERAALEHGLARLGVLADARGEADGGGALARRVDAARGDLVHVGEELRLGDAGVADEQDVDLAAHLALLAIVLDAAAKELQQHALFHVVELPDARRQRRRQVRVQPAVVARHGQAARAPRLHGRQARARVDVLGPDAELGGGLGGGGGGGGGRAVHAVAGGARRRARGQAAQRRVLRRQLVRLRLADVDEVNVRLEDGAQRPLPRVGPHAHGAEDAGDLRGEEGAAAAAAAVAAAAAAAVSRGARARAHCAAALRTSTRSPGAQPSTSSSKA